MHRQLHAAYAWFAISAANGDGRAEEARHELWRRMTPTERLRARGRLAEIQAHRKRGK